MALSGYQGVDIPVNIKMAGLIHDTYTVQFTPPAYTTLDHSAFTFTNANYNVNQVLKVNCNAAGTCRIKTRITAPYWPGKVLEDSIEIEILALPLDSWVGDVPEWYDGSGGNLSVSHNNVVIGHKANLGSTHVDGLALDLPFFFNGGGNVFVDLPDGSHDTLGLTLGSTIVYQMLQLGVYRFRMSSQPCFIQEANIAGHIIQRNTWNYTITDASGTVLVPTVTTAPISCQGFATEQGNNGLSFSDTPRHPDGPFNVTTPAVVSQNTFVQSISFQGGGGITQTNCTGGAVNGASATVVISGTRTNFPFGVSCNRAAIEVWVGGQNTSITFGAGYNN